MEPIVDIVKALSTPAVLVVIWLFLRKDIRSLTLPGIGQIDFREPRPHRKARQSPALERLQENLSANWENTGSIYWLGHDLMRTMQYAVRGADRKLVLFGLKQSLHHLQQVELKDKAAERKLARLIEHVQGLLETEFSRQLRERIADDIDVILDMIGAYMEANQPGFEPFAEEFR